ncbi:hypothetical protein IFM89_029424 [Coptis chinensis]|uniref:Uncharacterized protein n=1 Tax=Coptis chinensis TaxID=261450 RepID=A0A835IQP8_9MAGN|nr:hypothetical protein IFM89_029424 [Coptis chinensis]
MFVGDSLNRGGLEVGNNDQVAPSRFVDLEVLGYAYLYAVLEVSRRTTPEEVVGDTDLIWSPEENHSSSLSFVKLSSLSH